MNIVAAKSTALSITESDAYQSTLMVFAAQSAINAVSLLLLYFADFKLKYLEFY